MESAFRALELKGVLLETGLTPDEFSELEKTYRFSFPPDLREFLGFALPVSRDFPNWRHPSGELSEFLSWPFEGICFDVDNNAFWLPQWGPKPEGNLRSYGIVHQALMQSPVLIPIFSHRYMPSSPNESGNPIYSVYQTDIIYYGHDLPSYLAAEFQIENPFSVPKSPRHIPFWGDLVS